MHLTSVDFVFFFFSGDKDSRRIRMLNDIHLLSRDAPLKNHGGSLILVSDHFFHDPYYMEMFKHNMESKRYACVLISNMSDNLSEWPGAIDRALHFGVERRVLKLTSMLQVPGG